jgi:hypothetical protein
MPKRSDPANAWYGLARWQRRRRVQLRDHPLCRLCLQLHEIVTPAIVADHVESHHGDRQRFETGALKPLCTFYRGTVKGLFVRKVRVSKANSFRRTWQNVTM